jgi:hypothetical protein
MQFQPAPRTSIRNPALSPRACICFSMSMYPFSRFDIQYAEDVFYPRK